MRVAIVHHQFKLKGGMETYLLNLINGFNKQNDQVSVYVYQRNSDEDEPNCRIQQTNLSWLPRVLRKYWFRNQLTRNKSMAIYDLSISLMRSYYNDIIVCGGTHRGYLANMKNSSRFLDKLEIACEVKSYRTATKILAHSGLLKNELIELYNIPSEKIFLCHPPIDTKKFNQTLRSQRDELRKKFNINLNKRAILFPSTGHKRKGFHLIMDAFKSLPGNYELVIAGDSPAERLPSSCNYVGFVKEMAALYSACDITLLPSYYEPFGLVIPESVQCGTPVIISKFVGAKDLITRNEGIILEELSPMAIAKAIQEAEQHNFDIATDFAERNALTIDSHISKLKKISSMDI